MAKAEPAGARVTVYIIDVVHRPAVDAHPYRQTRLLAQRLADLQRALHRFVDGAGENERHCVNCRAASASRSGSVLRTMRFSSGNASDSSSVVRFEYPTMSIKRIFAISSRSFAFCSWPIG
jgi:hypothetical protein